MSNAATNLTVETSQHAGTFDDPRPGPFRSAIVDADGEALFTSGPHDTAEAAEADVIAQYAALDAA